MMKRAEPFGQVETISSDDSSDSDSGDDKYQKTSGNGAIDKPAKLGTAESDALMRRAKMYEEYMRDIPIPSHRKAVIPFNSWQGLAKSMKQLYGQPLHYLTNVLLKEWDHSNDGVNHDGRLLDEIFHPVRAEAIVWAVEEIHRLTSSHHHLAKLWAEVPLHQAYVDAIHPQTWN
ncbi:protein RDM1 isoform X2 [Amborella trichopoda]|uniref:Protein RDM1 n=1 Tax=Amborella trichopoda TaxID=13333 RepID=W1P3N0_AMBTC|nr:protein RDM1 isoform X2 [Amborella trichopoda]XP_020520226.1 protein RDM1 isoform X2 [Amborella trichopoda]ERN01570.1 hypothetical protein AMTR_s00002p00271890 [Amborella trichopoda]|eukprot:XP_006839001.1 protein RDM1 isoform X2 [Amborella trichopoda]